MAVNVNKVYQRVLTLANKEQRGYITPQQFNILANQAQMDIFEQYFYDQHQMSRLRGSQPKQLDPVEILKDKISLFETYDTLLDARANNAYTLPSDLYRLSNVKLNGKTADYVSLREYNLINSTPLLKPHNNRPLYIKTKNGLKVFGHTAVTNAATEITNLTDVKCDYIKTPAQVVWGYNIVVGSALHDASTSTNFELHESEEVNLVISILKLAGIMIEDPNLYQSAAAEEIKDIQQEKR